MKLLGPWTWFSKKHTGSCVHTPRDPDIRTSVTSAFVRINGTKPWGVSHYRNRGLVSLTGVVLDDVLIDLEAIHPRWRIR